MTDITFYPKNRAAWRKWLQNHHQSHDAVWLIFYKKKSQKATISYSDAVDEALCFGWIDSKAKPIDDEKFMQFFSKRKPKSVWSKVNKEKVEKLIAEGFMTAAGLATIEIARNNGSWNLIDDAEALKIPHDLEEALNAGLKAKTFFENLSRTDKRNMLQWLILAKRAETRAKRINEIAILAEQHKKPKQFGG